MVMVPLRVEFLTQLQKMTKDMAPDTLEINPVVEGDDTYGHDVQTYPHSGVYVKGRIQEVIRIPGTPDIANTTLAIGNFVIKVEADAVVPQKCQLVVVYLDADGAVINYGDIYQTQNVYDQKYDRLTNGVYCYRLK